MANLGNYLFQAEEGEDVIANDGSSFFANEAKQALYLIQALKSLPLSLDNMIYPKGYEEDLIQTERRTHFDSKEWIMPAFTLNEDGNISRILLIHNSHKEEGYVYQAKYKSVIASFYRGFSIQEFPNEPALSGEEFLESIGIQNNVPKVNIDDEDEDNPIIEIVKPSFSGFKKKKILNLGGKLAEESEIVGEDDNEGENDLQIEVHKSAFQAANKKKIANLGTSLSIQKEEREAEEDEEGDLHIDVSRPSFVAGSGKKPRNLSIQSTFIKPNKKKVGETIKPVVFSPNKQGKIKTIIDEKKPQQEPLRENKEINIQIERPSFVPSKQSKSSFASDKKTIEETRPIEVEEENEWGSIDIFKLKPQVFKGERGVVKTSEFSADLPKIEICEKALSGLKNIRISKKCVFAPKVWEASDPSFHVLKNFEYSAWDFLAATVDKDGDVIYALLSNKTKDKFSVVVSFKHHEPHIVGISLNGIALDDRALPYLNFSDLKKMVLKK